MPDKIRSYNYMISLIRSGSCFNGSGINRYKVISHLATKNRTNYVSFSDFCTFNFISKNIGRILIQKKYLICQRLYGKLWVCVNLECLEELKNYLLIETIYFDAQNNTNL
jgi:hypothetical protein